MGKMIRDDNECFYQSIIKELQDGEKTVGEIKRKFNLSDKAYRGIITVLTYLCPIYEYKVSKGITMLGVLK